MTVMLPAVAVNVPDELPAGTATEAGTLRATLLLDTETVMPPAGAAWLKATVHVEAPPESSVVGLQMIDDSTTAAVKEIDTVCDAPFNVAVIAAV